MINIYPSQERPYSQINRGDSIGGFWATQNIDLQSNLGVMRVAPRLKVNTGTADDADLGLPIAIKWFDGEYYAICNAKMFKTSAGGVAVPNSAFVESTETGTLTNFSTRSDIEIFDDRLWAISDNTLASLNQTGGTWTSRDTVGGAGEKPLTFFANVAGGRLYYIGATNEIWSIDAANTPAEAGSDYAIDLVDYRPTCMKSTSDSIWIGTDGASENIDAEGQVLQWDGISAQITKSYTVRGAMKIHAIAILNDMPYVLDSNGILSRFSGYSFEEVGRLPFQFMRPGTTYSRKNCMIATKNNTILFLVHNRSLNTVAGSDYYYYENAASGLWEWSEQFGVVHKYSIGYTPNSATTITDWGQNIITSAGVLFDATPYLIGGSTVNGSLLVGATYYTNATTSSSAILYDDANDTIQKKGYFVTTWFDSIEIQDKWERLWVVYKKLLAATDSIVFKYRVDEVDPVVADITWVNTTSFTTTTNISGYGPTATGFNGTQGGEVEILQGVGGGMCAHITNVSENAGTYTVTVDETATGATTTTAKARFQKWIKLNPAVAVDQIKRYSQYAIGEASPSIQIKCCMTFTGPDEFIKLGLVSNEDITLSK